MDPHAYHANPYGTGAKREVSNQEGGESVLVCIRAKTLTQGQDPMAGCTLVYPSSTLVALLLGVSGMAGAYSASHRYARSESLA